MINKVLNGLYYFLFFMTPLVMYPATSEIFEFNKMLFIYLLTALILFFWSVKMILDRKIILKKTALDLPIILFLASLVLSSVFSIDRHTSFFGYYGRFQGGLLSVISYIILYYGFISNGINLKKSLLWSLFSSVAVILWGLPGRFNRDLTCPTFNTILTSMSGKLDGTALNSIWTTKFNNDCWSRETNVFDPAQRMFSTLGQPNWLGSFLAVNFFIGVYFFINKINNWKLSLLNGVYLLLNISSLLFTRSRSALMAVGIGMALFIIYYLLIIKKQGIKLIVALSLIVLIPILVFKTGIDKIDNILKFQIPNSQSASKQPSDTQLPDAPSDVTESLDIRKIVWKGALDLGLKYPVSGTGVETFAYGYYFTRPAAHNNTTEWDFIYNKAHNEYLNYFATTGFVGLISYLFLIGSFAFYVYKTVNAKSKKENKADNLLVICLSTAWLTILITNFFGFSTTTVSLYFYIIPAIVIGLAAIEEKEKNLSPMKGNPYLKGTLISLSFSILVYVSFSIFSYFSADIDYGQGLYYSKPQVGDWQKAAYYFQEALKKRQEHVYEDKLSYALAYLSGIAAYQKNAELTTKFTQASIYYSQKSLKSSPRNVLYFKTLAKNQYLYYVTNQDKSFLQDGVSALKEAGKLAPTDPKIPYSLAVFYSLQSEDSGMDTGLLDLALNEVEKSIALKTDFYDSLFLKGQLLKKAGRLEESQSVFRHILKEVKPGDAPSTQELESF